MPKRKIKKQNIQPITSEPVKHEIFDTYQCLNDCVKIGFTVVTNNGITSEKHERYTKSCFFRAICDYLTLHNNRVTAIKIRQSIDFPKMSIEVDTHDHSYFIQRVCDLYQLSIAFFTVNTDDTSKNSYWIGNPAITFKSSSPIYSNLSIASYGDHYELIVSQTPFSPDMSNLCKHFKMRTQTYKYNVDSDIDNNNKHLIDNIISKTGEDISYKNALINSLFDSQQTQTRSQTRSQTKLMTNACVTNVLYDKQSPAFISSKESNDRYEFKKNLYNDLQIANENYAKQQISTEIIQSELKELENIRKSQSVLCRTKCLRDMLKLSTDCLEELKNSICAIELQLELI